MLTRDGGRGEGGAGTGCVPSTSTDQATIRASTRGNLEISLSTEASSGGTSRRSRGGRTASTTTATAGLGRVLDTRGRAGRLASIGINSLVLSVDDVSGNVEEIPDFVQRAAGTADDGLMAIVAVGESGEDLSGGVGLAGRGSDAGIGEDLP